jgi:hypothetical protein
MTSLLHFFDKDSDGRVDSNNWGSLSVGFSGSGTPGPTGPTGPTGPAGQGSLPVIRSGTIQSEPVNPPNTNITGTYAWYLLHTFQGTPNTQGVEVRIYMLVCRGLNTNLNSNSFSLIIPTPFAAGYGVCGFIRNQFQTNQATYTFAFSGNTHFVDIGVSNVNGVSNDSLIAFVYGI